MTPLTLKKNRDNGFRLMNLEVYNWGTFNKKVFSITPDGQTSLLTGENGSGKSTLVDSLLTLLVPNNKRNYNLASGIEKKKERNEKSYILGAYGRVTDEAEQARTQYLRKTNDYSVLLAVFNNSRTDTTITLAHFFWFENNQVKKFFLIAKEALSITEHFSNFSKSGDIKKRLKAGKEIRVFDHFSDYSKTFIKLFGLRSSKAIDLFNQTVSMKAISNLNDFVRENMLEKIDSREKIDGLKNNYLNLTASHDAIIRARKQLEQLVPIEKDAEAYHTLANRINNLTVSLEYLPIFFAIKKEILLEKATEKGKTLFAQLENEIAEIKTRLKSLQNQRNELEVAIRNNEISRRIEDIERQIEYGEKNRIEKKKNFDIYNPIAHKLKFVSDPDADQFYASGLKAKRLEEKIKQAKERFQLKRDNKIIRLDELNKEITGWEDELQSLRQRENLIPKKVLEIRLRISQALEIEEDKIPFICELIKVKPTEQEWEGVIERLLNNFALRLLVPENFYKRISNYVNRTDIKGRLVYHKISDGVDFTDVFHNRNRDDLFYKLDIKPATHFKNWLEHELLKRYNYICCDDMQRLYHEKKGLTKEGLIKSGSSLHEKDDRKKIDDKRNYVLGWSNKDKIAALEHDLKNQYEQKEIVLTKIMAVEKKTKQLGKIERALLELSQFKEFGDIDYKSIEDEINKLKEEKIKLEESSAQLNELRKQKTDIEEQENEFEQLKDEKIRKKGGVEQTLHDMKKQLNQCREIKGSSTEDEQKKYSPPINKIVSGETIDLDNVEYLERNVQNNFSEEKNRKNKLLGRQSNSMVKKMTVYIKDFPQEATELNANIESLTYFCSTLDNLRKDKLPEYEKRFKKLLQENVINDIVGFNADLDNQVTDIQTKIDELNTALKSIEYTPSTYIQLGHKFNHDSEIADFKNMLKSCIPDVGEDTTDNSETSFLRVKELIRRFDTEDRWRSKVTDVRVWLNFNASERYFEDNTEKEVYESSSGKSGGQTVKLAYTILASAIAYQFGLDKAGNSTKSFRFVVIDEVFNNLDRNNCQYAMELFQRLNLQLLIVTPFDKINLVEPYIFTCHLATNNEARNNSRVYNLTREELRIKRKKLVRQINSDEPVSPPNLKIKKEETKKLDDQLALF